MATGLQKRLRYPGAGRIPAPVGRTPRRKKHRISPEGLQWIRKAQKKEVGSGEERVSKPAGAHHPHACWVASSSRAIRNLSEKPLQGCDSLPLKSDVRSVNLDGGKKNGAGSKGGACPEVQLAGLLSILKT